MGILARVKTYPLELGRGEEPYSVLLKRIPAYNLTLRFPCAIIVELWTFDQNLLFGLASPVTPQQTAAGRVQARSKKKEKMFMARKKKKFGSGKFVHPYISGPYPNCCDDCGKELSHFVEVGWLGVLKQTDWTTGEVKYLLFDGKTGGIGASLCDDCARKHGFDDVLEARDRIFADPYWFLK
jgi:hypothetical protein